MDCTAVQQIQLTLRLNPFAVTSKAVCYHQKVQLYPLKPSVTGFCDRATRLPWYRRYYNRITEWHRIVHRGEFRFCLWTNESRGGFQDVATCQAILSSIIPAPAPKRP